VVSRIAAWVFIARLRQLQHQIAVVRDHEYIHASLCKVGKADMEQVWKIEERVRRLEYLPDYLGDGARIAFQRFIDKKESGG
jgi:hypothetical protein